ncbi:MAG: hypothetical protein LBG19_04925 [Prevotellaceae bacterium]|jgi:hypothetical protein|nr:hypothetical protein [Prevotellaceae bacterium]
MKRIVPTIMLCFFAVCGLKAQNVGDKWSLDKVITTETTSDGITKKEISATDYHALANLIGPKEIIFTSTNKLSYKRMENNDFETFPYTKTGKTLQIELSECLLRLDIEVNKSAMTLSENKTIDEDHTVKITYNYTK